jgi:hypothetical protein
VYKRHMKIKALVTIILAIVVVSCEPSPSLSPAVRPTNMSTPAVTFIPLTPTATKIPSSIPSLSLYTTATYAESIFSIRLTDIILRAEEIPSGLDYPDLRQPVKYTSSTNIDGICSLDCVKATWVSEVNSHELSILMARTETSSSANDLVEKIWNDFSQVSQDTGFDKGQIYYPNDLPPNSIAGIKYKEPDVEYIFVASRGPVVIVINYQLQAVLDLTFDFGAIEHAAILQVQKLEEANYPE